MSKRDPLFLGKENITKHYKYISDEINELVDQNKDFFVPKSIRFRKEKGFYTINIRWANAYTIENKIAAFLIDKQSSNETISLGNMIGEDPKKELIALIFKEAAVPKDIGLRKKVDAGVKKGCSINPDDLPRHI